MLGCTRAVRHVPANDMKKSFAAKAQKQTVEFDDVWSMKGGSLNWLKVDISIGRCGF